MKDSEKSKLIKSEAYPPKEILTRQQINQAHMDIQDTHPLRDMVEWRHILPIFDRFQKKDEISAV